MKISIIIPVKDDLRIANCIKSIDEQVEVVVSLNEPSQKIRDLVDKIKTNKRFHKLNIIVCEIKKASIAGAYNNGIKFSTNEIVLLTNSDCLFKKGTIRKMYNNLGSNLLSKGKLEFIRDSWITGVVARAREYHSTDKVNAYAPPLLFSKRIKRHINGYYFHPSLCWLEDSEFDNRVQKAGLKISYDITAVVYHEALTPARDLKSAFWYGVGKRIGVELGIHEVPTGVLGSIKKYIIFGSIKKGIFSGIYLFTWKMTLLIGYYWQMLFKLRR